MDRAANRCARSGPWELWVRQFSFRSARQARIGESKNLRPPRIFVRSPISTALKYLTNHSLHRHPNYNIITTSHNAHPNANNKCHPNNDNILLLLLIKLHNQLPAHITLLIQQHHALLHARTDTAVPRHGLYHHGRAQVGRDERQLQHYRDGVES